MKHFFLFLSLVFTFCLQAQHNYDEQGVIYSSSSASHVSIGSETFQGNYGDSGAVLELTSSDGAFLRLGELKGSINNIFLGSSQYGNALYFDNGSKFRFYAGGNILSIFGTDSDGGSVAISTESVPLGYKLAVGGKVLAEGVKVLLSEDWAFPDYVFDESYALRPLAEVKGFINTHHHLPEMPSASRVAEEGMSLEEMNILLLKKVEELTLYILDQEERIQVLEGKSK